MGNAALDIIIISRTEDKTEILWIGACAERQDKLCPEKDLKWITDKLKSRPRSPKVHHLKSQNHTPLKEQCLTCKNM